MSIARIRQEDEEEEARRRRRYPKPAPPPDGNGDGAEALAIIVPAPRERDRRRFFTCRCLDGSMIELEEGEKCPPGCYPITHSIAPYAPSRHRHGEHFCYCPTCEYEMSVEEGQKCNLIECPLCGARMRAVSTGEYRSTRGISQVEAVPIAPLLVTFGLIGFLAYMIVKRPFG